MRAVRRTSLLIAILLSAAGCAGSNLIEAGDTVFATSHASLAKTSQLVAASGATVRQQQLFMQAEGMYRYRYSFRERSFGSHLAQAAAIVTDIPALQAVAGNLDLTDLRLRSVDGAVQLWETLLLHHPRTPLRPLALYRLGWAYRSVGASGFPRDSGDEAFAALQRGFPTSPYAPLAAKARGVPWRSKETATALSVVPGLGQFYVGENVSGAVRLGIGLAAAAAIIVPSVIAYQRADELTWGHDWPLLAAGAGGAVVLMVDFTLSYQDSIRGVVEFNERAERRFLRRHPDAP